MSVPVTPTTNFLFCFLPRPLLTSSPCSCLPGRLPGADHLSGPAPAPHYPGAKEGVGLLLGLVPQPPHPHPFRLGEEVGEALGTRSQGMRDGTPPDHSPYPYPLQVTTLDMPGLPTPQVRRHLTCNRRADLLVVWWRDAQEGGWTWSSMAHGGTENLLTFALVG